MGEDDEKKIAVIEERLKNWMDTTTDYRITLCKKIDKIYEILNNLPCGSRAVNTRLLWGGLGITFGILIAHLGWK